MIVIGSPEKDPIPDPKPAPLFWSIGDETMTLQLCPFVPGLLLKMRAYVDKVFAAWAS
jgi:hypothetical protein